MENATKLSSLSVFYPCYNEEQNIPIFLEKSLTFLPTITKDFEIIIVDDGSSDNTYQITKNFSQKNKQIKIIRHQKNQGYGAALKSGFKAAKKDWTFFTDGDLQFDLTELKKFIPFTKDYQVIIGYRKKRQEGLLRNFNQKLWKLYIDVLYRLHVKDIDCAFKLFKTTVIQDLKLFSNGAFVSSEFLYKLKKKNYKFKQIAVTHQSRLYGKATGSNLKVILKAVLDALKIYLKMKFLHQ